MKPIILLALLLLCAATPARAQNDVPPVIPLWKNGAPGFEARRNEPEQAQDWWVKNIHNPSVTAFLPPAAQATGAAVIIAPGGGHRELVFGPEGVEPAQFFQKLGVAAFALKYRLAREDNSPYTVDNAADDVRRAMRLVRHRAAEWGIDPTRIGLMGWSAGGELSAMVTYGPCDGDRHARDPIDRESCRPDFQIAIYPGPDGVPDMLSSKPPPAFLLAAGDDVGAARTITRVLELYRTAGVPAEVHIYAQGQHAFNMGNRSNLLSIKTWPQRLADWMTDSGLLVKTP